MPDDKSRPEPTGNSGAPGTRQGALAASPGTGTTYKTSCEPWGFTETTRTGPAWRRGPHTGGQQQRHGGDSGYRREQEAGQLPAVSDRRGPGADSVQGAEDQRGKRVGGGGRWGLGRRRGPPAGAQAKVLGTLEAGRTGSARQCPPHKVPSRHLGGLMVNPWLLQEVQIRPRRIKTDGRHWQLRGLRPALYFPVSSLVERGSLLLHEAVGDPERTAERASTGKAGARAWHTVLSK